MTLGWTKRIVKILFFGVLFFLVFGFLVKALWNWLMPPLFGLHMITFWQAFGILLLSKILFGGFRAGPGGYSNRGWRRRMFDRWEKMTPEEREKFRQGMRGRCGPFGTREANT